MAVDMWLRVLLPFNERRRWHRWHCLSSPLFPFAEVIIQLVSESPAEILKLPALELVVDLLRRRETLFNLLLNPLDNLFPFGIVWIKLRAMPNQAILRRQ